MTWAQRLKRVFAIDIEKCVRIIASIEDTDVIAGAPDRKILKYLAPDRHVFDR